MKFPLIKDIATQSVVYVHMYSLISDALTAMVKFSHRSIVVFDNDVFRLLSVIELINLEKKGVNLNSMVSKLELPIIPTITKNKNILDTLDYLNNTVEHICVINEDNSLYGLVTLSDIISNIDPTTLLDNYKISDFLKLSKRTKWIDKNSITSDIIQEMSNESFSNVVIVENRKPIGIFTTKDIMDIINKQDDLTLCISHYMSSPIDTIGKETTINNALEFINTKHYKRAIIVDDNGDLIGSISQKELILLTYSKWESLMKQHHEELSEINQMLEVKNSEIEIKASTDSLTGLHNRDKFSQLYALEYALMLSKGTSLSLMLLDIDFFKKVNDNYGHNVGDKVLIHFAHSLLRILRHLDVVCRWGGEEFVILLPATEMHNAKSIAEKIRSYTEETYIEDIIKITVSIGISEVQKGDILSSVIERADKALYHAKSSGRNCVIVG